MDKIPFKVLIFAILFFIGISNALIKIIVKKRGQLKTMLTKDSIMLAILVIPLVIIWPEINWDPWQVISLLLIGFFSLAGGFLFYNALSVGNSGVVSAVGNSSALITIPISVLFLHEGLTWTQITWGALTIFGIVMVSIRLKSERKVSFSKGVLKAAAVMVIWGLVFVFAEGPIKKIGVFPALFLMQVSYVIGELIVLLIRGFDKPKEEEGFSLHENKFWGLKTSAWINILVGFLVPFGAICIFEGVGRGHVALTNVFLGASPLVTVGVAAIMYKGRQEPLEPQNKIGLLLALVSLCVLIYISNN